MPTAIKTAPGNVTAQQIERCGGGYLLSNPSIGALSILHAEESLLFILLSASNGETRKLERFLIDLNYDETTAHEKTAAFLKKLDRDGWNRTTLEPPDSKPLHAAYVAITLRCNLKCPYCFQAFESRSAMDMEEAVFARITDEVKTTNPDCEIIITGGEPFLTRRIFDYLDLLDASELRFSILTNGTLITDRIARRLGAYQRLTKVQVSIDGITESTNAITRGKGSLPKILAGIHSLRNHGIPLALAPTIHSKNLHELEDLARFALSIGAEFSPNNLRLSAHDQRSDLSINDMAAYEALKELNLRLAAETSTRHSPAGKSTPDHTPSCRREPKLLCGMARTLVSIDYNGDVYPCHLLAAKELKLGNIMVNRIREIIDGAEARRVRISATQISKCKTCKFVALCGGGCRAGAYYSFGSLSREDNLCDVLYRSFTDKFIGMQHAPSSVGSE